MFVMPLCLTASVLADNPSYQEGIQFGEKIVKEQLKQKMLSVTGTAKRDEVLKAERCQTTPQIKQDHQTSLYVFMSFNVPEETWLSLSEEIFRTDGTMVLRGLPNNSFKELAKRMHTLRKRGMKAQIQIDPMLFERFGINAVPTFVRNKNENFNKISGNISLAYALEKIE